MSSRRARITGVRKNGKAYYMVKAVGPGFAQQWGPFETFEEARAMVPTLPKYEGKRMRIDLESIETVWSEDELGVLMVTKASDDEPEGDEEE